MSVEKIAGAKEDAIARYHALMKKTVGWKDHKVPKLYSFLNTLGLRPGQKPTKTPTLNVEKSIQDLDKGYNSLMGNKPIGSKSSAYQLGEKAAMEDLKMFDRFMKPDEDKVRNKFDFKSKPDDGNKKNPVSGYNWPGSRQE